MFNYLIAVTGIVFKNARCIISEIAKELKTVALPSIVIFLILQRLENAFSLDNVFHKTLFACSFSDVAKIKSKKRENSSKKFIIHITYNSSFEKCVESSSYAIWIKSMITYVQSSYSFAFLYWKEKNFLIKNKQGSRYWVSLRCTCT